MKKIGILGGTFNPPHTGHFMMALYAYSELKLDEVLFLPTGTVPHKDNSMILSSVYRLDMLELVISRFPFFKVSSLEIQRGRTGYTYETLGELKELFPEDLFYFIVGADSLDYMDKWREPQLIFERAVIVAVQRAGVTSTRFQRKIEELNEKYHARIFSLLMPMIEISSTEIRNRVHQGKPIDFMTDPAVVDYIKKNGLYR